MPTLAFIASNIEFLFAVMWWFFLFFAQRTGDILGIGAFIVSLLLSSAICTPHPALGCGIFCAWLIFWSILYRSDLVKLVAHLSNQVAVPKFKQISRRIFPPPLKY